MAEMKQASVAKAGMETFRIIFLIRSFIVKSVVRERR